MIYVAYTVHVVVCLFLILVVLLQQGKGADLSVFGGGSTQSAFGARGAATLLHKLTVAGFIAFIFTTITIGFLQSDSGGSVMSTASDEPSTTLETTTVEPETSPAEAGTAPTDDPLTDEESTGGVSEEGATEAYDSADQVDPPDSQ